jgi:hypothetical protein
MNYQHPSTCRMPEHSVVNATSAESEKKAFTREEGMRHA